jgi:hypothetical protein
MGAKVDAARAMPAVAAAAVTAADAARNWRRSASDGTAGRGSWGALMGRGV